MANLLIGAAKMAANMLERTERPACIEGAQELLAVAANAQREIDDLHQKLDKQEGRAELAEAKAAEFERERNQANINYALEQDDFREYRKEAEALIEKLVEQLVEINKAARLGSSLLAADLATISRSALSLYAEWKSPSHD